MYTKCLPRGPYFRPFRSAGIRFQDTRLLKIGNFGNVQIERPQTDFKFLTVKCIMYTKYFGVPNLGLFCSMASHFQDTRLSQTRKIEIVPNDLKMTLSI